MLIPSQRTPPSPEAAIRQEVSDDGRVERASEDDGRRKVPDEFSAVFAALACQANPVPRNEAFQSNGEDGIAASGVCVAKPAPDDAAPVVTAMSDVRVEVAAAGTSFTTDACGPPPGFAAADVDAGLTAPASAAGRLEIPATKVTGGPAATGDMLASTSSGPKSELLVHVVVSPAAVGAVAADCSANFEVSVGSAAAPQDSVADGQTRMNAGTPPGDASDGRDDAPNGGDESRAEPQRVAETHTAPEKDGLDTAPATLPLPHSRPAEGPNVSISGVAPDRTSQPAHHAAELVRQSLPQVAEAAQLNGHGTVEITLSPEELGHVRLTIHSDDGATATVRLSADRHETLDLMRRHIDLLAQDLRDLGYRDLSFSFQDRPQRSPFDFNRPGGEIAALTDELPSLEARAGLARASARHSDGSLDLRL